MVFKRKLNNFIYLLFMFSACGYYSLKGSLPAGVNSIYVSSITNNTSEFTLTEKLNEIFIANLISKNILKLKYDDSADSRLDIIITKMSDQPSVVSNKLIEAEFVEEWKFKISVSFIWTNNITNKEIINKNIASWGLYGTGQDIGSDGIDNDSDNLIDSEDSDEFGLPRESAMKIAIEKVANEIINELISTW